MGVVSNATHDRKHADTALEHYVTHTLMDIITVFFSSPFSDQSTTIQVRIKKKFDQLKLKIFFIIFHTIAIIFHTVEQIKGK